MFHNSPKKFPQFFKPWAVFPMVVTLSRCFSCRQAAAATVSNTHGESNQRNHDKDMAARVHPSHDTHDTFFPPSTRWRSPRCRGRERGLKCPSFFRSVESTWINMFFWGGAAFNIHPWIRISILMCFLFKVFVLFTLESFGDLGDFRMCGRTWIHGVGHKNLRNLRLTSPCAAAFGHLLDKYCKRLLIKSRLSEIPKWFCNWTQKPAAYQATEGTKCPIFLGEPHRALSGLRNHPSVLNWWLVVTVRHVLTQFVKCLTKHHKIAVALLVARPFWFVSAPVCQKLLPLYTCAAVLRYEYVFNNIP